MTFKDAVDEEYELSQTMESEEPLLPHHQHGRTPKPRSLLPVQKRRCNFMALCALLAVVVLLPSLGLAGCALNQQKIVLPEKLNEWLGKTPHDQGAFPTNIGYPGPTVTGVEAALVNDAPALPAYSGVAPLVPPTTQTSRFNIMQHWGNLSPYYSVESHGLPETSSLKPQQCEIVGMHWLQRHGARYPTSNPNGPGGVASRLKAVEGWKASGDLEFLNDWEFKLGAELLTPFGRQQLFNLGVSARMKYGFLLNDFKDRLPVFRTETQDRMLRSAQNFATGFFGYPAEEHFNLEVMVEAPGFNCTLAPYHSCPNDAANYPRTYEKLAEWEAVFLAKAKDRLQRQLDGYDLSFHDVRNFMEMCAYETVAVGYSQFCSLFTQKEWKGFEYHNDLYWWNAASFGSPTARASGLGWLQETVARLTHTPLTEFNSTTNSTLHDDVHFPLNNPMYFDFTHDTTFAQLLPTMNLTSFAATGDLPTDRIPKHRSFIASKICPFATNMQLQVLKCGDADSIRIILNDAVVPLTGIQGCPEDEDGICSLDTFVSAMQTLIGEIDFAKSCGGTVNESPVSLPEAVEVPESQEDETTATEDESLADEDSTEAAVDVSPEVEA